MSSLSREGFSNGPIRDDWKEEEKVPIRRERLTLERRFLTMTINVLINQSTTEVARGTLGNEVKVKSGYLSEKRVAKDWATESNWKGRR